jgi:pimeloyl-ACP methyl ester carboxylesterase
MTTHATTASPASDPSAAYAVRRAPRSRFVELRGLRHHLLEWGDAAPASPRRPTLVMLHGWMDVAASFQFVVDALAGERHVIAPDWRGFGLTDAPKADGYWFPDYLADLDALLDALAPRAGDAVPRVDLLGHSMGGNVAMLYAGVRPERIRRLVNLEGFGMPATAPSQAPQRYRQWLDELKTPASLAGYASLDDVAARLRRTNPLLPPGRAAWLARQWSREVAQPGGGTRYEILADAAHKRVNPVLYQVGEALECWKRIEAPLLWVEGDRSDVGRWWGTRYTKEEFHARLAVVRRVDKRVLSPAGHMLHHDRPEDLARALEDFLDRPDATPGP